MATTDALRSAAHRSCNIDAASLEYPVEAGLPVRRTS